MIYALGFAAKFERWRAAGHAGWGYDELLLYFVGCEGNSDGWGVPYHGESGARAFYSLTLCSLLTALRSYAGGAHKLLPCCTSALISPPHSHRPCAPKSL